MLGPLLAMPSGQGLNMTLLAILKVNRANWLLVLEIKLELRKNVSTIDKISLLVRQHYYDDPQYDDSLHYPEYSDPPCRIIITLGK